MELGFDALVAECRAAYAEFQQLADRTDQALYRALAQVHALRFQMRTDARLQGRFAELLQQHTLTRPANETLFLVKYAFFPHTLQPGPGHKGDITKASRYAKLINAALAEEIEPADFVAFAKEHGIQRTAAGSRRFKRGRLRRGRRGQHRPQFDRSPVPVSPSFVGQIFPALELSFGSIAVAAQLRDLVRAAERQPIRLLLTVYVTGKRALLTGCTGDPGILPFPEGTIAGSSAAAPERAQAASETARPVQFARRPGLPVRTRGTPVTAVPDASMGRARVAKLVRA